METGNERTRRWTDRLDAVEDAIVQEFGSLSREEFNRKPGDKNWSIAETIAHLVKVNNSYFPVLENIRKGRYIAPLTGKIGFMSRWLGKMILQSVRPGNKKKYTTMPVWHPGSSDYDLSLIDEFRDMQKKVKHWILQTDDLLKKSKIVSSPANNKIAYPILTAWEIIVTHEERHLEQARRVLKEIQGQ